MSEIVLDKEIEERVKKVADKNWIWLNDFLNLYLKNFSEKDFFKKKNNKIENFSIENFNDDENNKIKNLSNFNLFKKTVWEM